MFSSQAVFSGKLEVNDMSSRAEKIAVLVKAPRQGETYRVPVTASSVVYNLPSNIDGSMITCRAIGRDIQYQFGVSGDTLSLTHDQASGGTPPTMTANNASGITLKDGDEISFTINGETQFAVISDDTGGNFELYLSSHPYNALP